MNRVCNVVWGEEETGEKGRGEKVVGQTEQC
jgi:hypothetical protein